MPTSSRFVNSRKAFSICGSGVPSLTTRKLLDSAVRWPTPARTKPVTVSSSPMIAMSLPSPPTRPAICILLRAAPGGRDSLAAAAPPVAGCCSANAEPKSVGFDTAGRSPLILLVQSASSARRLSTV
ncbi:unnamed protein product [Pelagomonas calceolata]|uniref:Uncharacterized protein n=1 Tax=Pelagomonas calceolata TaxID=35677 RepID=A0A8J2SKL5_9STRA|nr:unnamed protein product [Pelagomonas calceolata]